MSGHLDTRYYHWQSGREFIITFLTRDYVDGIEYLDGVMEAIYHSEGRVKYTNGTARYEYTLRDHLGNGRVYYTDLDGNGVGTPSDILQSESYYAFGLQIDDPREQVGNPVNPYQYNGKELNTDFGLNWHAYGARYYDAAVGRFTSVDPLAEKAPGWTPYRYAFNNPIRILDPDGQFETPFGAWLYKVSRGNNGSIGYSEDRKEYFVLQSNGKLQDHQISWSANSDRPGGGLINAIDKIPKIAGVFGSHAKEDVLIPHGQNIGKGMQYTGDAVELGGWATSAVGGSGMIGVFTGKAISILGIAIENWSRLEKDGLSKGNAINIGIDIGIDVVLPAPLEDAIDRSGLGSSIKAQARGILSAETKLIKEQVKQSIDDQ